MEEIKKAKIAAYQKEYQQKNREKIRAQDKIRKEKEKLQPGYERKKRNRYYLNKYGITLDTVEEMIKKQKGGCAICLRQPAPGKRFHVDHCHTYGRIRGILCAECNWYMAKIDKDKDVVRRLSMYRGSSWETFIDLYFNDELIEKYKYL